MMWKLRQKSPSEDYFKEQKRALVTFELENFVFQRNKIMVDDNPARNANKNELIEGLLYLRIFPSIFCTENHKKKLFWLKCKRWALQETSCRIREAKILDDIASRKVEMLDRITKTYSQESLFQKRYINMSVVEKKLTKTMNGIVFYTITISATRTRFGVYRTKGLA